MSESQETSTVNKSADRPVVESFTSIAPFYDQLMASVPYRFWMTYIEALWRTHNIFPRRVLDLACGTGSMSLIMAKTGIDVVGVDRSPEMIDVARRKAKEQNEKIEYRVEDALTMTPIRPPVDSAICLFDSLNNILEHDALADAFRNVKRSLRDGGVFIFDVNTAYAFRHGMFNQRSSVMDEPLRYIWKSKYDESSQLCQVTMEFEIKPRGSQSERSFTEVHLQKAYSRVEIEDMLNDAGFGTVSSYDAYSLLKPKKRSDRIFWVAE